MVERIIAAAHDVLIERGYDATTTNHIAEAAGISPGSLYQYFPNKAAILTRVINRYAAELAARMSRAFLQSLSSPTRDGVRATVTALLDAYEEHPDLLRVFVEQTPRTHNSPRAVFARRMDDITTAAIMAQSHDPDRPAETMAWLVVRTVEHVTISYVLERPHLERETVIEELTDLITGYLDQRRRP
jgi:AcrR family transcriptional regulator